MAVLPSPGLAEPPAPASASLVVDAIPVSALSLPSAVAPAAATPFTESVLRRSETVFFIALPFSILYSAVLSVGAALAIEGRRFTLDSRVVIPTVCLAVGASSYVVWADHHTPTVTESPSR